MAEVSSSADTAGRERLDAGDRRLIAVCLVAIVAGGAITGLLFRRAFPEAAIEFRVNRSQARSLAEKFLAERRHLRADARFAGRFSVDDTPKVYLERELGLERAARLYGTEAKIWHWDMRWFRSGAVEQENVSISPRGDVVAFEFVRRDDAPGPSPPEAEARALATSFLSSRGLGPGTWKRIESTPLTRPHRVDWTFVDEKVGAPMGEATVRFSTTVAGGEVSGFREFVHVPESWERDYGRLRSKNNTAGAVATFGLFVTALAMIVCLVWRIIRHDVRWPLVAGFGLVAFALSLISTWNGISVSIYEDYDTASSFASFLTSKILYGFLGAIGVGAAIAFVVASAEPEYRQRYPNGLALRSIFTRRGMGTKRFFLGLLLGWALVAFFFAYQAVFYVVAARLGAWSPADVPYSDEMLNTAVPWATVLFIGFLPAVFEEGMSRLFSISLLERIGAGRFVAVVLPAAIWGFGHAAYPNQPFYIRGLEVGFAGILIGLVFRRFGAWPLLVWHFSVDAIYTALILIRSGNPYYVVSGAVSAGILLIPLAASLFLARRRGGFLREVGLTNGDDRTVVEPKAAPEATAPVVGALPAGFRRVGYGVALVLVASFLIPTPDTPDPATDHVGPRRARDIAAEFLRANGVATDGFRDVTYPGTGFAESEAMREGRPEEHGHIPAFSEAAARYVLQQGGLAAFDRLAMRELPVAFWVTRFYTPEKKEEWKVLVDARRGRVVGFVNPKEEAAPAGEAPSADRAKARASSAAARLGYPAAEYRVADVGTRDRPKRRDTTVVLESSPAGIGEARPRLMAVFQGARLATFLPSVRVPETFLREDRKRSSFDRVLPAVRFVSIGILVAMAVILFIRRVRAPDFHWREFLIPAALAALLTAGGLLNGVPTIYRAYETEMPMRLFQVSAGIGLLIVWLVLALAAYAGFVLLAGAWPGWVGALRRRGGLRDPLLRAAAAAAGLAGIAHLQTLASRWFPALLLPDPALPGALATAFPAYSVFFSTVRETFVVAVAAAVAALAWRNGYFRKPLGVAITVAVLAATVLPSQLTTPRAFLASYLPDLASLAWLAFCALVLLADRPAAWVFFGVFAFGGPAVVELLSQDAAPDRRAGWVASALIAAAAIAAVAGRREAAPSAARFPASPEPPPVV